MIRTVFFFVFLSYGQVKVNLSYLKAIFFIYTRTIKLSNSISTESVLIKRHPPGVFHDGEIPNGSTAENNPHNDL